MVPEHPSDSAPSPPQDVILYKRNRFQSRLPRNRRYTASHFWLEEQEPGLWRVGFTRFATRMLGEIVEVVFEVQADAPVSVGQMIGGFEGFKARSDLYCVADGAFAGANSAIDADPSVIDKDPYYRGWLYRVRGQPDPNSVDVDGYIQILDGTIDKMLG